MQRKIVIRDYNNKDVGYILKYGKDTDGTVKKEQGEMITEAFVNSLNSGSDEKPWRKGTEYPVLSWQIKE